MPKPRQTRFLVYNNFMRFDIITIFPKTFSAKDGLIFA